MAKKNDIGVIGLGKFGSALAATLTELGSTVLAVDQDEAKIQRAQDLIPQVYQADATDKKALEQLGFQHMDHVIVSIGKSMEASILVVLNLQEMGVKEIWVKAASQDHEKVLARLGVKHVVFPEQFVATQIAHRLAVPGVLDYLTLAEGVILQECKIDRWSGKSLRELNLRSNHNVQVVAIRRSGRQQLEFIPDADRPLEKDDSLVIIGNAKDVRQLKP